MHWETGMPIGFSPVWINAGQCTDHFKIRFAVRQTADMQADGSAQKLIRLRCGSNFIGTFLSKPNTHPMALGAPYKITWFWDHAGANRDFKLNGTAVSHPADGQWNIYELEIDYRSNPLFVTLWINGVLYEKIQQDPAGLPPLTGTFQISPFNEMYSCGSVDSSCSVNINTGEWIIDDFTLTILP